MSEENKEEKDLGPNWLKREPEKKRLSAQPRNIRKSLGKVGDAGESFGTQIDIGSNLGRMFNCNTCTWRGTVACPHGLKAGQMHKNKVCSTRMRFVKEFYKLAGTKPKYFQMEELVKLKFMSDYMWSVFSKTGEVPSGYAAIAKNVIALTDKMRRQDEGIKLQGEITHTIDDFRRIVDIQAKALDEEKQHEHESAIDADFEEVEDAERDRNKGSGSDEEEV